MSSLIWQAQHSGAKIVCLREIIKKFKLSRFLTAALGKPALYLMFTLSISGCTSPVVDSQKVGWVGPRDRQTLDLSADLKTLDGKNVALSHFENKVLFVNFWATWCGPCRAEMPSMSSLFHSLKKQGLDMVAISDEDPKVVRHFLETNPYPFEVWLDPNNTLAERFNVLAIPTTLILDSQRQLVFRHTGSQRWDTPDIIELFRQILREPREL